MTSVCVCGGGNLGHVVAGFLAAQEGVRVSLLTRHPERWGASLAISLPDQSGLTGRLGRVSSSPAEVVAGARLVVLCLPGYAIGPTLQAIAPHVRAGSAVASVVSSTGFFDEAFRWLSPDVALIGFQRVPFICRTVDYGHHARLLGFKSSLSIAVERSADKESWRQLTEQLMQTPTRLLNNHYEASLTNSNPLLHPARLYSLWKDWRPGQSASRVPLFYEEWTDEASEWLIRMDGELQRLLALLPVEEGCVPTILDYYESRDAASLTRKLRSIGAFKGIAAPMKRVDGGFVPDFGSRYFTEDFPYGLALVSRLGHQRGLDMPAMDHVLSWGERVMGLES